MHKGIAQEFKFHARTQNAHGIDSAMNSMCNTLCNFIRNNRNNTTQKISIGITEHFSKPKEVLNDEDLVDLVTSIIHKTCRISIRTNEKVYDDKYHQSNAFALYPRSSIRKLLDDLTTSLIQNQQDNVARLEGANNHNVEFIDNIYVKFHVVSPPSARNFAITLKKLLNKNAIVNLQNKDDVFYMQQEYLFLVINLVIKISAEYLKHYQNVVNK